MRNQTDDMFAADAQLDKTYSDFKMFAGLAIAALTD